MKTHEVRGERLALLLALLPALLGMDLLQSRNRATEAGNQRFKAGKAEEALAEYDKAAAALPNDPAVQFNRGAALYSLSRFDEAGEAFLRATEGTSRERKASAFYNLGNSYYQTKKWKEAVAAFRKALSYDPGDMRAKWNLELAMRKKTEDDKKDENKDDKNKDDKNKDENKDDKQDQAKNDDKQGDKDKQDKKDDKGKNPDQPEQKKPPEEQKQEQANKDEKQPPAPGQKPQEPPGQASKPDKPPPPSAEGRELEAILDNLEKSPKSLEAELAKLRAAQRRPPAKDW